MPSNHTLTSLSHKTSKPVKHTCGNQTGATNTPGLLHTYEDMISILEGLLFRAGNRINLTVRSAGLSMRKMLKAMNPAVVPLIWLIYMDTYGQIHHQNIIYFIDYGKGHLGIENIIFSSSSNFIFQHNT